MHKVFSALRPQLSHGSSLYEKIRLTMYCMCIRPVLTYGLLTYWDCLSPAQRRRVQTAQNKVLKAILNLPRRFPTVTLHQRAKIQPIKVFVNNMIKNFKCIDHENPLVRRLADVNIHTIPYRIKYKFPLNSRFDQCLV